MARASAMTIGLILIFLGVQLFLVKSYLLTPTATQFFQEHFNSNNSSRFSKPGSNGVFGQPNVANNEFGNNGTGNGGFANASSTSTYPGQSWPYYQTDSQAGNNSVPFGTFASPDRSNGLFGNSGAENQVLNLQGKQRFVPPRWIMWPALFLGSVFFLHGIALRD